MGKNIKQVLSTNQVMCLTYKKTLAQATATKISYPTLQSCKILCMILLGSACFILLKKKKLFY